MEKAPTKQSILMERSVKHVENGQQLLVFTDFVDVAQSLENAYTEIGIRAGVFGSKNLKKRDENRVAFQNGDLDVLICTRAAERGLNASQGFCDIPLRYVLDARATSSKGWPCRSRWV